MSASWAVSGSTSTCAPATSTSGRWATPSRTTVTDDWTASAGRTGRPLGTSRGRQHHGATLLLPWSVACWSGSSTTDCCAPASTSGSSDGAGIAFEMRAGAPAVPRRRRPRRRSDMKLQFLRRGRDDLRAAGGRRRDGCLSDRSSLLRTKGACRSTMLRMLCYAAVYGAPKDLVKFPGHGSAQRRQRRCQHRPVVRSGQRPRRSTEVLLDVPEHREARGEHDLRLGVHPADQLRGRLDELDTSKRIRCTVSPVSAPTSPLACSGCAVCAREMPFAVDPKLAGGSS